jgi:hypothetical protein
MISFSLELPHRRVGLLGKQAGGPVGDDEPRSINPNWTALTC